MSLVVAMSMKMQPDLGVGVGLRVPHYAAVLRDRPEVDFFEVISENFMVGGGKPLHHLARVLEHYRVVQHGVSLGIAGPAEPDREYLSKLKQLIRRTQSPWVSDHFCWCGAGGAHHLRAAEWKVETERQTATGRSGADDEGAAGDVRDHVHSDLPHALAAMWIASRTC